MFTGIIEETGKILNISSNKITVECETVLNNTNLGDSISVNGVCLTVSEISSKSFSADISPETFNITAFKKLKKEDYVNLERAMILNGRFGGHVVTGHIDGIATFINSIKLNSFYELEFEINVNEMRYIVKKGSITIDGISLTVAEINKNNIKLAIIPHTYENTNLKYLQKNDIVNIEVDILAKYIEKFLSTSDNKSRIDLKFLQEHGF